MKPSTGLCQCGCGTPTNIAPRTLLQRGWVEGEPLRFIKGHNGKTTPQICLEEDRGYKTLCCIWQGLLSIRGYGITRDRKRAQIVFWEKENGPVPEGMVLHHLCEQKDCVRPDHIEPRTRAEHLHEHKMWEYERHSHLSAEQISEIKRLHPQHGYRVIARQFGISKSHVANIVKGNPVPHPKFPSR